MSTVRRCGYILVHYSMILFVEIGLLLPTQGAIAKKQSLTHSLFFLHQSQTKQEKN